MASSGQRLFHTAKQEASLARSASPAPRDSPSDSPRGFAGFSPASRPALFTEDAPQPSGPLELVVSESEETIRLTSRPSADTISPRMRELGSSPDSLQRATGKLGSSGGSSDKKFIIRNTDTGEEIDLRDENKATFPQKLAKVLSEPTTAVQTYCKQKREMNEKLWEAIKNRDVTTCFDLLSREKHGELLAQPNAKGLDDWTSLHLAAHSGSVEICEVLLRCTSIDIDPRSTIQRTPLHVAASKNYPDIIDLLLHHGADINAVDSEGCTALHMAASLGHINTVKRMLNYDPDFTITNRMEKTCYDVSATPEISDLFETCFEQRGIRMSTDTYSRTKVGSVLMHNSRADMITKILYKAAQRTDPQALRICFGILPKSATGDPLLEESYSTSASTPKGCVSPPAEEEKTVDSVSFHDFTPICPLGRGAFGEVYLIRKNDSGELFAMKLLKKESFVKQNLMRYAVTERNVLTYLKHPFIVSLKYAFQTPEKLALIMDYCPGGSLGGVLMREKKFNEDRARFYACEVLLALEELHSHGIVYRDLKPDNIVLDAEGHALLTDFGLSKEGITESMMTRSFCGSVAYLPPEMLSRGGHTHTADYYLFGVLLYEMLIGCPPYYSSDRTEIYNNILHQKLKLPKKLSASVRDLISNLLDRNQKSRLGGASGVRDIKAHSWFAGVNWDAVYRKELRPVPVPEKKRKTPVTPLTMDKIFHNGGRAGPNVDGWSFVGEER